MDLTEFTFTDEEKVTILEIANLALSDTRFSMRVADSMDLTDESVSKLHDKIIKSLS